MGLNTFKSLAPPFFGIKTTKIVFRLFSKVHLAKKISEYIQNLLLYKIPTMLPKCQWKAIWSKGFVPVKIYKSIMNLFLSEHLFQPTRVLITQLFERHAIYVQSPLPHWIWQLKVKLIHNLFLNLNVLHHPLSIYPKSPC